MPFLTNNQYSVYYIQKRPPLQDGSLIAFNMNSFSMIEVQEVHMYDEHFAKSGQVGLVMALLHKATNQVLVVGTTHLAFNPYRGDWKLHQSAHLLATIDDVVRRQSHQCSVIVCGDLNSTPDSHLLKYFVDKNGVDFSSIKAMNVSGQTEPPEQRYKLRHGAFGEQRIEHNNLLEAGFNLDSTFGIRYVDYPEESRPNTVGRFYNTLELKSAYKNGESTSYMSDGSFCVDYILHNPRLAVDDTQESVFEQLPILILKYRKQRKTLKSRSLYLHANAFQTSTSARTISRSV